MTTPLEVDTGVLRSAASEFTAAGDTLAGMHADAPLGDAAAAVPQLQTAAACNAARTTVVTEMSTIADTARTYGSNLRAAATEYDETDAASGDNITGVDIPAPAGG